jgi:hypothetical protein
VGIALVGVALFAALGSNAGPASRAVTPRLTGDLRAAGFPAEAVPTATRHFQQCFQARARAHDPTVPAPGCDFSATPVSAAFQDGARGALRRNFTHAFQVATLVNIAAVAITLLLALLLSPRTAEIRVSPAPVSPS